MNKTHCDICDATPAKDEDRREVSVPGKPHWDRSRLGVSVWVDGGNNGEGIRNNKKDVCDDCRRKLVADAFGLRTPNELTECRDERNAFERALKTIALGGIDIETALTLARQAVGDPTPEPVPDADIPF